MSMRSYFLRIEAGSIVGRLWIGFSLFFILIRLYAWHMQDVGGLLEYPLVLAYALISDTLCAGLLAWPLLRPAQHRVWRILLCLVMGYGMSANLTHIQANITNLSIEALDAALTETFISSLALDPALLQQAALLAVLLWVIISVLLLPRGTPAHAHSKLWLLAFIPGFYSLDHYTPVSPYLDWVYTHPLAENISSTSRWMLAQSPDANPLSHPRNMPSSFKYLFAHDLSGEPIVPYKAQANVLLISLEDLSGKVLEDGSMPYLQAFAQGHISPAAVLNLNVMSNNGIYAMLCGDYPNFYDKNPSQWVRPYGTHKTCLPSQLKSHGYHTAFLIASPLSDYNTDKLTRRMGFEVLRGQDGFHDNTTYNKRGLDDASFSDHVLDYIRAQPADKPWFITAYYMGTHPNYNLPPDYIARFKNISREKIGRAYTDDAIHNLLAALKKEGLLNNMLLIITSDESRLDHEDKEAGLLASNRGFMIIAEPSDTQSRPEELFLHSDLPLTVEDYLGIPSPDSIGRSAVRRYHSQRDAIFSNVYQQRLFWLHGKDQSLSRCNTLSWECTMLLPQDTQPHPFDRSYKAIMETKENAIFMQKFLDYNDNLRIDWYAVKSADKR